MASDVVQGTLREDGLKEEEESEFEGAVQELHDTDNYNVTAKAAEAHLELNPKSDNADGNENIPQDVISPPSRPQSLVLETHDGGGGAAAAAAAADDAVADDDKDAAEDFDTFGSSDLPDHLVSPGSAASSSLYSPQHQTLKGEFSKDGDLVMFTADNLQVGRGGRDV